MRGVERKAAWTRTLQAALSKLRNFTSASEKEMWNTFSQLNGRDGFLDQLPNFRILQPWFFKVLCRKLSLQVEYPRMCHWPLACICSSCCDQSVKWRGKSVQPEIPFPARLLSSLVQKFSGKQGSHVRSMKVVSTVLAERIADVFYTAKETLPSRNCWTNIKVTAFKSKCSSQWTLQSGLPVMGTKCFMKIARICWTWMN